MSVTHHQHTTVLRDTSLWLLFPPYFHLTQDKGVRHYLGYLGIVLAGASCLYWSKFNLTSWRRKLDILCASLYLLTEFATSPAVQSVLETKANSLEVVSQLLYTLTVALAIRFGSLVWFVMACERTVGCNSGLICHLMFRYLAWVAVMREYLPKIKVVIYTILFVGHTVVILAPKPTFIFVEQCAHGKNLETLKSFGS